MCQKMFYRNVPFRAAFVAPWLEIRYVKRHVVGKTHLSVLHQTHERKGSTHALAQRREIEYGILRHGYGVAYRLAAHGIRARTHLPVAVSLQVEHVARRLAVFSPSHHAQHRPGKLPVGDGMQYNAVGQSHPPEIETGARRAARTECERAARRRCDRYQ